MIEGETEEERLEESRRLFEEAVDFWSDWQRETEEDIEFYHGDQWNYEDARVLQEQRRPVLVMNVLQAKVSHMLGAQEDNAVDPVAVPTGAEDQFLADAVNHLRRQMYEDADVERVDMQIFEDGIVAGIGNAAVDAFPDPDDPSRLKLSYDRVHPLEVMWDPASERRDKSDAQYLAWSKWFSKAEFKAEYPEFSKREVQEMFDALSGSDERSFRVHSTDTTALQAGPDHDGYLPRRSRIYYDGKRRQVRVIRIECIKSVKKVTAYGGSEGDSREVDPRMKRVLEQEYPGYYSFEETWVDQVYWYEFTGAKMLWEGESPEPFDGFSVRAFVFKSDDDNRPYGIVRLLKDPQREVNKRYSQILHWIMSQSAPGLLAEQEALVDLQQAQESLKTPAGITMLRKGSLVNGAVKERQLPVFPDAVGRLQEIALRMIDLISNVHVDDMMEPRGIPEAAATTQLKHRRSLLSMKPILGQFHYFRREVCEAFLQSMMRWMPDEQIQELMGNDERFVVQDGQIADRMTQQVAKIENLRDVKLNIRLEPNENNQTERLLELQTLMGLQQQGIPIDPEVMFDFMSLNPARRDRLKAYARQAQQQSAENEQRQMQSAEQQMQATLQLETQDRQLEAQKLGEDKRSNVADERNTSLNNAWEFQTRLMDLWIKAEEADKDRLADSVLELARIAVEKSKAAQRPSQESST